jgi:3-deoxy-D-manno-octulosonic-acid transferase
MGGAIVVRSSEELASAVARLLADPAETERVAAGGARAIATLTGALERTVTAMSPLMAKKAP